MVNYEWTAAKFFYFFFFMFFTLLSLTYYGMMSIAITPNVQLSTIISSSIFTFFNLFSGFLIPRPVNKNDASNKATCELLVIGKKTREKAFYMSM
jgi:hypothetical protein